MAEVSATRTPCTDSDLADSLHDALLDMGVAYGNETLAVLCSHVAFETGHMAELIRWNYGNYKRGPGPDWCSYKTFEYLGKPPVKTVVIGQFSAWADAQSAAAFYVPAFAKHWPEAWAGALDGNVTTFCAGLKKRDYFTAPLDAYTAGMQHWFTYYMAYLGGDDDVTQPDLEDLGAASTVELPTA